MPQLSVIMPVYNAGAALAPAVRSTLAALPPDSVLIALDDGSSDDSVGVLQALSARHRSLTVLTNDHNLGVARTLNRLLDACDSPWVARMDADDLMLPWRLRLQQQTLGSEAQTVLFSTVLRYVPHQRKLWPQRARALGAEAAAFVLLLTNPFVHSTMYAPTELLRRAGGYREVPSEDYDLWMRLALSGRLTRRLAAPTVVFRHHPGQLTSDAGWVARARDNELTADVHAELARRLLDWNIPVFTAMRGPLVDEAEVGVVSDFVGAVTARAARVGLAEVKPLKRELEVWQGRLDRARSFAS